VSHTCTQHPQSPAAYRCDSCFTLRCRECVNDINGIVTCTSCGQRATPLGVQGVPAPRRETGAQSQIPPPPSAQMYGGPPAGGHQPAAGPYGSSSTESGKVPGWVWFVLVYGVGNFILYKTTGILLLPIPRR